MTSIEQFANGESDWPDSGELGVILDAPHGSQTRGSPDRELGGYFLLKHSGCELPKEVVKANINGQFFTRVNTSELAFFHNLVQLEAADNFLNVSHFGCLRGLRVLNLSQNNIEEVDLTADVCRRIERINLSLNPIQNLADLCILERLVSLNLSGCGVVSVPWSFVQLEKLEALDLSFNQITEESALEMWQIFSYIPKLETLNLCNNQIRTIQEPKSTLSKLRLARLDLSNNLLDTEFDISCLIQLGRLTTFLLYGNRCIQKRNRIVELFQSALGTTVVVSEIEQKENLRKNKNKLNSNYRHVKLEKVASQTRPDPSNGEFEGLVLDYPATGARMLKRKLLPPTVLPSMVDRNGKINPEKVSVANQRLSELREAEAQKVGSAFFLTDLQRLGKSEPLAVASAIIVGSCAKRDKRRQLVPNDTLMDLAREFLAGDMPPRMTPTPVCFKFLINYFGG